MIPLLVAYVLSFNVIFSASSPGFYKVFAYIPADGADREHGRIRDRRRSASARW